MKIKHLLPVALAIVLGSCSTAYRSGQTPDDVYYSPAPEQPAYQTSGKSDYVTTQSDQDRNSYNYRNGEESGIDNPVNRNSITFSTGIGYGYDPYFSPFNDFYNPLYSPYGFNAYGYSPYGYSPYGMKGMYDPYGYGFNDFLYYNPYSSLSFMNPYSFGYSPYSYNGFYSPYYSGTKNINTNTGVRRYNLNAYNNNAVKPVTGGTSPQPIRTVTTQPENGSVPVRSASGTTTSARGTAVGNVIRRVFTPSTRTYYNSNGNRTYTNNNSRVYNNENTRSYNQTPERSYQPSAPSSSSSSGSGGGGSAPVRSFRR